MRPTTLKLLLSAVAAVLACSPAAEDGAGSASSGGSDDSDGYHGLLLTPLEAAPDFAMEDQNGDPFVLSEQKDRAVLMFFGYTNCPDVCPTTLAGYVRVRELLGEKAEDVGFVFISVDGERDTPAALGEYLGHFEASFIGLRADDETLEVAKASYGVFANALVEGDHEAAPGEDEYLVAHTDHSFLVDPQGRLAVLFRYGTAPKSIAEDIRQVLG